MVFIDMVKKGGGCKVTREQMKSRFVVHTNGQDEWIKVGKRTYDKAIDMFCDAYETELKVKDESIEELKAMVQKMKCCENCNELPCDTGAGISTSAQILHCQNNNFYLWELKK